MSDRPAGLVEHTQWQRVRAIPGSLLWLVGATLFTVVYGVIALPLACALPHRARFRIFYGWSTALLRWTRIACGIHYQVQIDRGQAVEPSIVMCKHQSAWETLALMEWFQPQTWVLKRELLQLPFIGWALALLNPIAIDRRARKQAMTQLSEQGAEQLRAGRWVVIFPEGTRIPAGRSGRYRRGGAALAVATGTPVVPVAHNAGELWPRNSLLKFPGTVNVHIGPPMSPEQGETADAFLDRVQDWIENHTRALSTVYEDPRNG